MLELLRRVGRWWLWLVLLTLAAWSALPPLSPEEQRAQADHVLLGQVNNVGSRSIEVANGTDRQVNLNFRVDDREKGSYRAGLTLTLKCRQTERRPAGWAGPQGQNEIPPEGSRIRAFVRETPSGELELLEPNGWEPWSR